MGSPDPDTGPSHWDPRILGVIGLVCSIFLLFSYYKILERNCATFRRIRQSRSRRHRRRINEHLEEFSSQFQSRALDSCIMHSIPITQIKKSKGEEPNLGECAVCLGEFEEDEWVKHLPKCFHVFHVACIDTWFQTHSSCPLCRSLVCDTGTPQECVISVQSILETLEREDFRRERSQHQQVPQLQVI